MELLNMLLLTVFSFSSFFIKKGGALVIYRARYSKQDKIPIQKCTGENNGTVNIEFTDCVCKEDNDTFYDHDGFQCASPNQIQTLESCDNWLFKRETDTKEQFKAPCTLPDGKESIKIIIRDHGSDQSYWNENFSIDLVNELITIDDNGLITFNHKQFYFTGLLVKIQFHCKRETKCILLKSEGTRTYPFVYNGPSITTTTITSTTTTTTSTPTTTKQQTTTEGNTFTPLLQQTSTTKAQPVTITPPLSDRTLESSTTTRENPITTHHATTRKSTTHRLPMEETTVTSTKQPTILDTTIRTRSSATDGDDDGVIDVVIITVVVAVGVILLLVLVIFIVCRKRRSTGNNEASSAEDLGRDYASYSSEIAINKTDRNKNSLSIDLTDSPEYQDIGKSTPNYIPLESAFSNEAYTDLKGNDPEYRELETEPVYNILEENPVYQETSEALPRNPQPPMAPPERRRSPPKPPTPFQESSGPVATQPPDQEDYYSAAAPPPYDIAELYAPVIKPRK